MIGVIRWFGTLHDLSFIFIIQVFYQCRYTSFHFLCSNQHLSYAYLIWDFIICSMVYHFCLRHIIFLRLFFYTTAFYTHRTLQFTNCKLNMTEYIALWEFYDLQIWTFTLFFKFNKIWFWDEVAKEHSRIVIWSNNTNNIEYGTVKSSNSW